MSDILCVTDRSLCEGEFLTRIEQIAKAGVKGIILRDKKSDEASYKELASSVLEICKTYHVPCILHSFKNVAAELCAEGLHMPLTLLRNMTEEEKRKFSLLGASCHSVEEAVEAERLGCTYLVAGHVFETDCKAGLPGRGTEFLENVCRKVKLPVYGIGGINSKNYRKIKQTGATGCCIMSGLMRCADVRGCMEEFENEA